MNWGTRVLGFLAIATFSASNVFANKAKPSARDFLKAYLKCYENFHSNYLNSSEGTYYPKNQYHGHNPKADLAVFSASRLVANQGKVEGIVTISEYGACFSPILTKAPFEVPFQDVPYFYGNVKPAHIFILPDQNARCYSGETSYKCTKLNCLEQSFERDRDCPPEDVGKKCINIEVPESPCEDITNDTKTDPIKILRQDLVVDLTYALKKTKTYKKAIRNNDIFFYPALECSTALEKAGVVDVEIQDLIEKIRDAGAYVAPDKKEAKDNAVRAE